MGLEDLAMMRAVHGSTVLYPADGTSTAALVQAKAVTPGLSYLRTTRGAHPGLYPAGEAFPVGGSKVLRSGAHDDVTLVGAGIDASHIAAAARRLAAGQRRDQQGARSQRRAVHAPRISRNWRTGR
jgi:transketolase